MFPAPSYTEPGDPNSMTIFHTLNINSYMPIIIITIIFGGGREWEAEKKRKR